jgi:hypothetical protein
VVFLKVGAISNRHVPTAEVGEAGSERFMFCI